MPHKIKLKNFEFTLIESLGQEMVDNATTSIILMPFSVFDELDLADEIDGVTATLAALVSLSAKTSSTVFCGIKTAIAGLKHISIAVAHKGRLIDIVDRTANPASDIYSSGDKIKIFSTEFGRIAVLVDTDVLLQKNWAKVAGETDIVLAIMKDDSELFFSVAAFLSREFSKPLVVLGGQSAVWQE